MALTDKQENFCLEYVKDFNGAQAAIRAEYAKGSARVTASKLLTNANIQERIKELTQGDEDEAIKEFEAWKQRQLNRANANVLNFVDVHAGGIFIKDIHELSEDQQKLIKKVTYDQQRGGWAVELHDPQKADIELAKAMGWYKESPKDINISGEVQFKPTKIVIEKD